MYLTTRERADEWLADLIARYPTGVPKDEAILDAERNGVSKRGAERAASRRGVTTAHNGPRPGIWRWPAEEAA